MKARDVGRFLGAVAVVAVVGCSAEGPIAPNGLDPSFDIVPDPDRTVHVAVCKVGLDDATLGQSFSFATTATGGEVTLAQTSIVAGEDVGIPASNCESVWRHEGVSFDSDTEVTITEAPLPGYELASVRVWDYFGYDETFFPTDGSITVTPGGTRFVVFYNRKIEEPVPGRMTGGGHQIRVDGVRVTRGLTLHCDITLSNNLEMNWAGGNNWHLEKESLESVECIDDPAYDPVPPDAPFDTFIARALGSLNQVPGSIIDFKFIDNGEPGRTDEAHFTIYAPNMGPGQVPAGDEVVVLEVGGQLDGGNLQAHYDQPHS